MQSLVKRQIRSVVPGIVISLAAMGVLINILVSKKLVKEFDELLLAKSNGLIALTEDGADGFEVERYEVTLPNYTDVEDADYFEFLTDEGEVTLKSLSLDSEARLPSIHADKITPYHNIKLPDGRAGRVLRTRFLPRVDFDSEDLDGGSVELNAEILDFPGTTNDVNSITALNGLEQVEAAKNFRRVPLTLQLASSRENLDDLIRSIQFLFIVAGLLTTGLILFVLSRGTNRAMEPLNNLSDQVAGLDERQLNQKLTLHEPVSELNQLVERFNYLLSRLQEAFNREKRFTGDMAHELRTPISEIKSLLDVRKRWPEDLELQQNFVEDIEVATSRMQRTIEDLLILTRAEGQQLDLARCDDLSKLLDSRIRFFSDQAKARNITIDKQLSTVTIPVLGFDQWFHIIDNLLQNATDYSEPNTTLEIQLYEVPDSETDCVLELSNITTDLAKQDLTVMFERLWQKDASRTSEQHSGLGLALVTTYAQQIGASVVPDLVGDRLFIRVHFKHIGRL